MIIEIVRRPMGEAPEWVRDAWIGLRLPLEIRILRDWPSFGVISGPSNVLAQLWAMLRGRSFQTKGYVVNAKAAVELLAGSNLDAANWWRQNTPWLLDGKRNFAFDQIACEALPHEYSPDI